MSKRPVRLLVPSPPGGPSDFAGRLIAPGLSEALGRTWWSTRGQSVNGVLSMKIAAKSAPDGSTLAIGNNGTHVVNVGLYRKLPYESGARFVPVSLLISAGTALVAFPKIAPRTFREFIDAREKEPAGSTSQCRRQRTGSRPRFSRRRPDRAEQHPVQGQRATEIALMSGEIDVALLSIPS